jgi:hypothetical protein
MGCVNKNTPDFKKIADVYGESLAEKFVIGYSKNVKHLADDFFYPSIAEIKDWLTMDKSLIVSNVVKSLGINPGLSVAAIKGLLKGVVHNFQGSTFITSGPTSLAPILNVEMRDTIFRPNLNIMTILANQFPNRISIQDTRNQYRKIVNIKEAEEATQTTMFSKPGETKSSTASPKTLSLIKDFLKRIGVETKNVDQIVVNGIKQNADGVALLTQKLIQVMNGKDADTLPEEAMHFAVAIIKQTNPALYTQMMNEVNGSAILNQVFKDYGDDPFYQKDGKRDIIKLKEEAVGKLLAEAVIRHGKNSVENPSVLAKVIAWWNKFLDKFREKIVESGFDRAAMDIISGKEIGTAEDIREMEGVAFLQQDAQSKVIDLLEASKAQITLKQDQAKEEDNGYYKDGKKIPRRVSEIIKSWYETIFKNLTKNEYNDAVADLKAKKGTAGHKALEYALNIFVDAKGYLRETPLDDADFEINNPEFDRAMYELLKENLRERLATFDPKTRFLSEMIIHDPKRGVAGTVDFIAVEPSGKTHILDWKFMGLNVEKYDDVPWYKVNAWQRQMNQYKVILQTNYGVKSEDFGQTRMIPIYAKYSEGNAKEKIYPVLLSIKIGDVNIKNIVEDYLLPVGIETEKTGNAKIDELLEKLNAVYKRFSDKKVIPSEKQNKAEQLNSLFTAIRQLQVRGNLIPLLNQAKLLNQQIERTIEKYNDKFVGKDSTSFSQKEINDFAEELQTAQDAIGAYTDLNTELSSLFDKDLTKEEKKVKKDLRKTSENAKDLQRILNKTLDDYAENIIAKSEGVLSLLAPEKVIRGITRLWASTSTLQVKAVEFLYKKANKAFTYSAQDSLAENRRLEGFKEAYQAWASAKGLSSKNYFDLLKKKDKNELIDEYDPKFYDALREKMNEKDSAWVRDNLDVPAYNEFLAKKLEEEYIRIENKYRIFTTEEQIDKDIKLERADIARKFKTSTTDGSGWLLYDYAKKFPKSTWQSQEWKTLNNPANKPALDFYNYIKERNEVYRELGYIGNYDARTFLPFVRKGLTEKIITGGQISLGEQFFRSISIDEGDIGYGQIDPLTGRTIDTIPKYFVRDIDGELSTDLFRTMSFYNEAAIRYKHLSEIEEQVRAIVRVERNKKAISTSLFGKTVYKDGQVEFSKDNSANSELVESMMKAIVYGQKYTSSESFDQLLGKIGNWGDKINEKLGMKIFPPNLSERQISLNKIITNINTTFQINVLGLNVLSATSNFFGGNSQSLINAGIYFNKTDYAAAELMIVTNKFRGTDQKKMLGALEYFLPLTDNYNREIAKKLSIHNLTAENLQDGLMYFMRKSDWNVQSANFYAYLKNTIVQDGQVLNVREYLRKQDRYADKYAGTSTERKAIAEAFEKEVKDLIEDRGILKIAEIKDGRFTIPGVDQKDQSVVTLRRIVQKINKDALGALSEDDLRMMNMNIYGKSFMVFHNWIPRLVDVRMGNMKYNNASDAYEWGRVRMLYRVMSDGVFSSLGRLTNSLVANDKGVEYMIGLYEKKKADYENDTGKTLNMTQDQFIDLVRHNIRSNLYDAIVTLSMLALYFSLKALAPDDDEDPRVRAQYRFLLKATDKLTDELTYFYNPASFAGLASTIFPAMGLITNFSKLLKNFGIEMFALAQGDEKKQKETFVLKYLMKTFPVSNQMAAYLPMFYPALAKDLGLKVQSNYGIR